MRKDCRICTPGSGLPKPLQNWPILRFFGEFGQTGRDMKECSTDEMTILLEPSYEPTLEPISVVSFYRTARKISKSSKFLRNLSFTSKWLEVLIKLHRMRLGVAYRSKPAFRGHSVLVLGKSTVTDVTLRELLKPSK